MLLRYSGLVDRFMIQSEGMDRHIRVRPSSFEQRLRLTRHVLSLRRLCWRQL